MGVCARALRTKAGGVAGYLISIEYLVCSILRHHKCAIYNNGLHLYGERDGSSSDMKALTHVKTADALGQNNGPGTIRKWLHGFGANELFDNPERPALNLIIHSTI
jgi:hypothetical protein